MKQEILLDYENMPKEAEIMLQTAVDMENARIDINRQLCTFVPQWKGSAAQVFANAAGSTEMAIRTQASKITALADKSVTVAVERMELDKTVSKAADWEVHRSKRKKK